MSIFILLSVLWFILELKYILFWLYLWQLKDYHIGRFIDHFRTYKGKKLFSNRLFVSKVILLALFFGFSDFFDFLLSVLSLLYATETVLFLRGIINRSIKKPVATAKILFLLAVSSAVAVLSAAWAFMLGSSLQPVVLLCFDIIISLVISVIVLLFQPFFVLARNITLHRAGKKLEKIKAISGLKIIAITGSYGKTSTKEFLATILSKKYKVLKTNRHQNSEIGVAKCVLHDLKSSHQIFIAEVGAYNKGKVKEVCSMLKPKIGIVTGVNEQHLALFGSLKNLLSAEGGVELASALPKGGLLVVNGDNKYCLDLYKNMANANTKIYSLSNKIVDSDIWAEDAEIHKNSISFFATDKTKEGAHFNVRVLGKQNVQNILGAILVARELGMTFDQISEGCRNISQYQAGMVLKTGKHDIYIIDSSYSSNPDGVFADLNYLSVFKGKRAIVMPCLIELGEKSSEIHEKIGRKIAEVCDLAIITSKDKFKEIEKGFWEVKMGRAGKCLLCDKPQDIYSAISLFCKSGDAVLLEGRVPAELIKSLIV